MYEPSDDSSSFADSDDSFSDGGHVGDEYSNPSLQQSGWSKVADEHSGLRTILLSRNSGLSLQPVSLVATFSDKVRRAKAVPNMSSPFPSLSPPWSTVAMRPLQGSFALPRKGDGDDNDAVSVSSESFATDTDEDTDASFEGTLRYTHVNTSSAGIDSSADCTSETQPRGPLKVGDEDSKGSSCGMQEGCAKNNGYIVISSPEVLETTSTGGGAMVLLQEVRCQSAAPAVACESAGSEEGWTMVSNARKGKAKRHHPLRCGRSNCVLESARSNMFLNTNSSSRNRTAKATLSACTAAVAPCHNHGSERGRSRNSKRASKNDIVKFGGVTSPASCAPAAPPFLWPTKVVAGITVGDAPQLSPAAIKVDTLGEGLVGQSKKLSVSPAQQHLEGRSIATRWDEGPQEDAVVITFGFGAFSSGEGEDGLIRGGEDVERKAEAGTERARRSRLMRLERDVSSFFAARYCSLLKIHLRGEMDTYPTQHKRAPFAVVGAVSLGKGKKTTMRSSPSAVDPLYPASCLASL